MKINKESVIEFIRNICTRLYMFLWNLPSEIKKDLRKAGDYLQFITPIAVFIFCTIDGNMELQQLFLKYYLICAAIQIVLKWSFNAVRPSGTEITNTVNPLPKLEWSVNRGDSFPSGHTMSAISGGLFWTLYSFGQPYIGIVGIALGIITAISRMVARAHWALDVGTSIVIATIVFYLMT